MSATKRRMTFGARTIPADFAEHAYEPIADLRKRYSASYEYIAHWREQIGVTAQIVRASKAVMVTRPLTPMPQGFAEYQRGRTTRELEAHYQTSRRLVSRWLGELGIFRNAERSARAQQATTKPSAPSRKVNPFRVAAALAAPVDLVHRDYSRAGQAADFLRRFGPVKRCNAEGHYDPAGDHWLRGSSLLNAEEIIGRAVRNGWPDPLASIAA